MPVCARVQLSGRNGNENVSNDGPKWSNGNHRTIACKSVVKLQIPPHPRIWTKLVRSITLRPFRLEGRDLRMPTRAYNGLKIYAGLDPAVLMQPMAVTSPQEESQSGTIARHAAAGPDAGRPTAFPDESLRSEPEERPGDTAGTCGERKP